MKLPTKDEINVFNSPDENTALKHFYNKTLQEIELSFRDYGLDYCQDLMWMGPVAFNFYLQAVIQYLESKYSADDSDFVNCLYSVIKYRWDEAEFSSAFKPVGKAMDYIIDNYNKFEIDESIYGDLLSNYQNLQRELKDRL